MSKLTNQLKGSGGLKPTYEKVFKIKSLTPESKKDAGEYGRDINLTLELSRIDNEGTERTSKIWLNGDFYGSKNDPKAEKNNIPVPVKTLLVACDVYDKLPEEEHDAVYDALKKGEFPMIILPLIEGTEIKTLEYVAGTYESATGERPSYRKWNRVTKPNGSLEEEFLKEYARSGYPKKYSPEVIDEFNKKEKKEEAEIKVAAQEAVSDDELI